MSQVSGRTHWFPGRAPWNPQTRAISLVESSRSHAKSISSSQSPRIPSDPCTTLKPIELGRAPWSRFARFRGAHPHISRHPIAAPTHHFERYSTISPRVAPITFPRTPKSSPRVSRYRGGRPVPAGPLPTPIFALANRTFDQNLPAIPLPARSPGAALAGAHCVARALPTLARARAAATDRAAARAPEGLRRDARHVREGGSHRARGDIRAPEAPASSQSNCSRISSDSTRVRALIGR